METDTAQSFAERFVLFVIFQQRAHPMAEEPLFMAIRDSDPEFRQTILDAQASLPEFRHLLQMPATVESFPCIKTRLTAGKETAFIWLLVVRGTSGGFVARVFEIPPEFEGIQVGDLINVSDTEVMDWMVNQAGVLHGGYSLRYQRSKLPPERRAWFDRHVGVAEYAEPPDGRFHQADDVPRSGSS